MSDCEHEFHWYLSDCNEEGWKCWMCKAKAGDEGYSPKLDRVLTDIKVRGILRSLHDADIVYISNSDMGDHYAAVATTAVENAETYDQWSIVLELMRALCGDPDAATGHASFWKRRAEEVGQR